MKMVIRNLLLTQNRVVFVALSMVALSSLSTPASAADPDIRSIKPMVLLAVDTSGSMERRPDCTCSTPLCHECLPMCGAAPLAQRNRWAVVTEALTGSFASYSCTQETRSGGAYVGQYDENYYVPHIVIAPSPQAADGILDAYRDRVRFGLMTFDGVGTLTTASPLVEKVTFEAPGFLSNSISGLGGYSYGSRKEFWLPGCPSVYMMDNGAKNEAAPVGRLISVGHSGVDDAMVNASIQAALPNVRPYGATPIAGMLDDVLYYFNHHPDVQPPTVVGTGDIYANCRPRYVLLLTDGYPNNDMREAPFNCEAAGSTCPYKRPHEIAHELCTPHGTTGLCTGKVKGVFVVGFSLEDAIAKDRLDLIAASGGTTKALFADDPTELRSRLAQALDVAAAGTTTRTVPVFSQATAPTGPVQLQFSSGFNVSDAASPNWSGILERTRFECNASLEPEAQALSDAAGDRFHKVLNARSAPRVLYTVLPTLLSHATKHLTGVDQGVGEPDIAAMHVMANASAVGSGGPSCGPGEGVSPAKSAPVPAQENLTLVPFSLSNPAITPAVLGAASVAERDAVINWVHATSSSNRSTARLGDIYHSTPVTVAAPQRDLADESYNLFRVRPEVKNRPTMVYVGTNDGILHAFVAEQTSIAAGPYAGTTLNAGEELWGFIPPVLLPKLKSASSAHQIMVDGPIVVKDVYFKRSASALADGSIYRTVLVFGLRAGGNAYIALDITDPFAPKFLWQFSSSFMGETYGIPALGQALVTTALGTVEERAIAVLPGGNATAITDTGGSCDVGAMGCAPTGRGLPDIASNTTTRRSKYKCWGNQGRSLFVLDIASGQVMRWFDDKVLNSPLIGGVALFSGDVGTVASRGFVTDADGVLWRLDLGSRVVSDWDLKPAYDMYWNAAPLAGEVSAFPPVLALDAKNKLVILQATGDIDRLDVGGNNRVVSITENIKFTSSGALSSIGIRQNWLMQLPPGDMVTGPLELFNETVYFGTFKSAISATDGCNFGSSRLCGVHYKDELTGSPQVPKHGLESVAGSGVLDTSCMGPYANQIIMGVSVTQRPTCFRGAEEIDPYFGTRFLVSETGGGDFRLVAQLSGAIGGAPTGAVISTFDRQLPARRKTTRLQSWAASADQ